MSWINYLYLKFFCRQVGMDQFGNKYFLGKDLDYLGNRKRYVWYSRDQDGSRVPPQYHAWLHYLSDVLEPKNNFDWQVSYMFNVTGTSLAYHPTHCVDESRTYSSWKPNIF